MTYSFVAGNVLTAAQLNALAPVYVLKQNAETVTGSTTLQNDDELLLVLPANKVYEVELNLVFGATTVTTGLKVAWTTSGTLSHTGSRTCRGPGVTTTNQNSDGAAALGNGEVRSSGGHALTTAVTYGNNGTQNTSSVVEKCVITTGASGGTLQLQWACQAAGNATVVAGSYLIGKVLAA